MHPTFAAILMLVPLSGCVIHSSYMSAGPASAVPEPSPNTAVVTFIRPSHFASTIVTTILDENAHFVGGSESESQFTVAVSPGHHVFVVWAENTDGLVADVLAGKHYFVEVSLTAAWLSARGHLIALTPHSPRWHDLQEWRASNTILIPNHETGEAYVESRKADAVERVQRAMEHLSQYDAVDMEKRTIRPDDGI